jgi:Flp pilus assembly pilin Flp
MLERLIGFVYDEEGVTMVEYALILGLVAVAAILAWTNLGSKVGTTVDTATSKLP